METKTILIALKFLWSLIKGIIGAKSPKERNAQLEKQLEKLVKKETTFRTNLDKKKIGEGKLPESAQLRMDAYEASLLLKKEKAEKKDKKNTEKKS